ncbi:DUF3093 domain-containing protein [Enemella sp. A6]|uniref:DUF3093 domain-containing protein n=1 Tax=Enemella sp. A6 TaxID=3440152 RepID=UPI003EB8B985
MEYRETVAVPLWWLIVGGLFCISTALVFLVWKGPEWAVLVLVGLTALIGTWMASMSYRVQVDRDGIRVGRGLLEWPWVGGAVALSRAETEAQSGPEADVRAWFRLPPYTQRAVRIEIDDPQDPHPHWLVGTRRPEEFAAAVRAGVEEYHHAE